MKVATWNARSMYAGKLQEVAREMERLDIGVVSFSEVRWAGAGHFTAEGKHMMIYSGCPKTRQNGVGFLVHQSVSSLVAGYNPVSDRLAVLRLKGKPCGITVVQVYAPTTAAEGSEIEKFYDDVQDVIIQVEKSSDVLIVLGDWNAKLGQHGNVSSCVFAGSDWESRMNEEKD